MDSYYLSKAVFKMFNKIRLPQTEWTLRKRFPGIFFYPHMTRKEYLLFKELCRDKQVLLEYGSGGSTIHLLKNKKMVFSVESNPDFYKYMSSIPLVKRALRQNLHYKYINLGQTNKWGRPLTDEHNDNWPSYYEEIWQQINPATHKVDVIFIDGRFRVSCCLYSILKSIEYNWLDVTFIIHDFWRREKYHVVLDFLLEVKSTENLVSFRLKKNISVSKVKRLLEEYSLVVS
jgi:hypothetical protein